MTTKTFRFAFAGIIALSLLVFLANLGTAAFVDYDEATYAQVIRSTEQSGDILSLRIAPNERWFEKPPLYFWAAMGSEAVFRSPTFSYRLPAALAGVAGIALVMLLALELGGGYAAALIAGAILLTTGAWLEAGRQVRMDVPVAAAILFSFYSFIRARRNPAWHLGVGVGIAAGVLTKGIIGFFPVPIILIWAVANREYGWLKNLYFWLAAVLALALLVPWHWYEWAHFGNAFWGSYFSYHQLQRFNQNILGGGGSNFDYIISLVTFSLPWTAAFIIGLFALRPVYLKDRKNFAPLSALACTVLFVVGVFLSSRTKLIYYFTPIYPFVAVFLAVLGVRLYSLHPKKRTLVAVSGAALLLVALVAGPYIGFDQREGDVNFHSYAEEEKLVGEAVAGDPSVPNTLVFGFPYLESLRYYSGGRKFVTLTPKDSLDRPSFLVVTTGFMDRAQIPADRQAHFQKLYEGQTLVLFRYEP